MNMHFALFTRSRRTWPDRHMPTPAAKWVVACAIGFVAFGVRAQDVGGDIAALGGCGSLENAYGPFDYNDPVHKRENLPIVERFHFTPRVESLTRGESGELVLDLNYTLRAFPNHARALWAMARYQLTMSRPWSPADHFFPIECYFDRAVRWRPNDANVWLVHGMYLAKKGDLKAAVEKYETALKMDPSSAEANYNAGLAYFELKNYVRARELAEKAYALGYPLPGLRNKLAGVGEWKTQPKTAR